jgi:hypothetical protein
VREEIYESVREEVFEELNVDKQAIGEPGLLGVVAAHASRGKPSAIL